MELRRFGDTGLRVTPIGLGLASLGRPGYINLGHAQDLAQNYEKDKMEENAHRVLDEAWKLGIRYFDTARSYGSGEEFLGNWLKKRNFDFSETAIGSKWGYTYTAKWSVNADLHEVKDHSLPVLQKQWTESQENLGSFLNLYQIHSATLESGVLENKEVLNELAKIKSDGFLVGLSVSGTNQTVAIQKAMEIKIDGLRLFDSIQATWNLLETSTENALMSAHSEGLGIIIKEGVANGRLTIKNTANSFVKKMAVLHNLSKKHKTTVDAIALAAILAKHWVSVVLSGAATIEHLKSNLSAIKIILSKEDKELLESLVETPGEYWEIRSQLAWN